MGRIQKRRAVSIKPETYALAGKIAQHPEYRDRWPEVVGDQARRHHHTGRSTAVELLIHDTARRLGISVTEEEVRAALPPRAKEPSDPLEELRRADPVADLRAIEEAFGRRFT